MQKVSYGDHVVKYRTFDDAATEVLRLNFKPVRATAGGALLNLRDDLKQDGYTLQQLPGGDYVLRIRHSSSSEVVVV